MTDTGSKTVTDLASQDHFQTELTIHSMKSRSDRHRFIVRGAVQAIFMPLMYEAELVRPVT